MKVKILFLKSEGMRPLGKNIDTRRMLLKWLFGEEVFILLSWRPTVLQCECSHEPPIRCSSLLCNSFTQHTHTQTQSAEKNHGSPSVNVKDQNVV